MHTTYVIKLTEASCSVNAFRIRQSSCGPHIVLVIYYDCVRSDYLELNQHLGTYTAKNIFRNHLYADLIHECLFDVVKLGFCWLDCKEL